MCGLRVAVYQTFWSSYVWVGTGLEAGDGRGFVAGLWGNGYIAQRRQYVSVFARWMLKKGLSGE